MQMTIGQMCDQLSIVNIKIFTLENIKRDSSSDDKSIADATRKTNDLNVQRSAIIEAIDHALNKIAAGEKQNIFGSNKMYGKR